MARRRPDASPNGDGTPTGDRTPTGRGRAARAPSKDDCLCGHYPRGIALAARAASTANTTRDPLLASQRVGGARTATDCSTGTSLPRARCLPRAIADATASTLSGEGTGGAIKPGGLSKLKAPVRMAIDRARRSSRLGA